MPIREYKCPECQTLTEKLVMSKAEIENPPKRWKCGRCGAFADLQMFPSSISLGLSTFSESPIDVQIGRDAEVRWRDIHDRQEARNKVRREAGDNGIVEVRKGEFKPMEEGRKAVLREVEQAMPTPKKMESGAEASKAWLPSAEA